MDQGLWQTCESIDFMHSSNMWIQTMLSCGKYCQTMQTGSVSRLRLRGRCWGLKIHYWRNIVHFWKSYICSKKLDVQETNISFSQFNGIWNYLSGHRTEIGWFARSGFMGSNCFCSSKRVSCLRSIGQPDSDVHKHHKSEKANRCNGQYWCCSFNCPIRASRKKLYCMCLRTIKLKSRWLLKAEVLQWDTCPGPTEMHLIGCSIELIWTPKSKSNTSTPKTNSQTF